MSVKRETTRAGRSGGRRQSWPRAGGFTLMELLVATGVTLLLLVFINGVFRSISNGVGSGMATSDILHTSRVISQQIAKDAEHMVGPGDNGVLVITNQWIDDVRFVEDDPDPTTLGGLPERRIYQRRADQIMFIRQADDLRPMTPANTSLFTPSSSVRASFAKVTYGHAGRVSPDGLDPDAFPELGAGLNEYAAQWVLGRQATLLATDVSGTDIYAAAANFDAPVPNAGGSDGHDEMMFNGITDIAYQGLTEQDTDTGNFAAMVGDEPESDDVWEEGMLYRDLDRGTDAGDGDGYLFRALRYTYAWERLNVNPVPIYDPQDERRYTWWQMMQMHPVLASGVTDFIVEFAGDYDDQPPNDGGRIDVDGDGRIRWYSIEELERLDQVGFETPASGDSAPFESPIMEPQDESGSFPEDNAGWPFAAFVFRHGDPQHTKWPHLIRIRYRITDPKARIMGADDVPGRMYEQIIRVPR